MAATFETNVGKKHIICSQSNNGCLFEIPKSHPKLSMVPGANDDSLKITLIVLVTFMSYASESGFTRIKDHRIFFYFYANKIKILNTVYKLALSNNCIDVIVIQKTEKRGVSLVCEDFMRFLKRVEINSRQLDKIANAWSS